MHITDPRGVAAPAPHERWVASLLRDERDLRFVRVAAIATVVLYPLAAALYALPTTATLLFAAPYLAIVWAGFGGRYLLLLHAVCHRPLFRRELRPLNLWIPWLLGPLFGCTPTSFYTHHVGMHHAEGNLESDLSSTLPYRRDHLPHFLHYWARFMWFGDLHILRYFRLRNRSRLYRSLVVGELSWLAAVLVLGWFDWAATLVVLVVPLCMLRWFAMCGNFAQHAFVDVDDPGNAYRNSTCLTNTPYNHKCYNDGYHIVHHLHPTMHWTEMPGWYEEHREEFARQDAIVFDGIRNNQVIWFLLMFGDYGRLADHMVDFHGRSREERIAFLKARVQRQRGRIRGFLEVEPDPRAIPG